MPITLQCPCGKATLVKEQDADRDHQCANCGNVLSVTVEVAIAAVQAEASVKSKSGVIRPALPDDDDAGMLEIRKPIRRPGDVRRSTLFWVIVTSVGVICFVLLLILGAVVIKRLNARHTEARSHHNVSAERQ